MENEKAVSIPYEGRNEVKFPRNLFIASPRWQVCKAEPFYTLMWITCQENIKYVANVTNTDLLASLCLKGKVFLNAGNDE